MAQGLHFEEIALFVVYRCKCGWERDRQHLKLPGCLQCGEAIPEFNGTAQRKSQKWIKNPQPTRKSLFYVRNERQLYAWRRLYDNATGKTNKRFFLYGGAVGGGKSYLIRWGAVGFLIVCFQFLGIGNAPVMIACEDYPTLKDRHLAKIGFEFPTWLGKMYRDHKEFGLCFILNREYGGGAICFRNLDDPSKYQSAEFLAIFVDELTKNPFDTFNWLRIRIRWPGLEDGPFLGGSNPGGVGHIWVKQFWIDKEYPAELADIADKFEFIPAQATDNPMLPKGYWDDLMSLPEEMREALVKGDWKFFIGQAFPEISEKQWPIGHKWNGKLGIPAGADKFMAMDWNYAKPVSLGWYFVVPIDDFMNVIEKAGVKVTDDELVVRYREFYGMRPNSPDKGLRMTPAQVADKIKEIEEETGDTVDYRVAGNDIFSPMVDGGPCIAEQFEEKDIWFSPIDLKGLGVQEDKKRQRIFSKMQMHKRFAGRTFAVGETCKSWWRTVPNLALAEKDPEDVEHTAKKQEDHPYDETRYALMSRPTFTAPEEGEKTLQEKIEEIVTGKMDESEIDDLFITEDGGAWRDNF